MLEFQPQEDIKELGIGGSAIVYAVTDSIVLKTPTRWSPIGENVSWEDRFFYTTDTVWFREDIESELRIHRLLTAIPHPNVIQAIATEHPEGVYLPRYQPLSSVLLDVASLRENRILLFRDIANALQHLHQQKLAHADARLENFLWEKDRGVILCDFTCTRFFGQENPSARIFPDPVGVNGPYNEVSGVTDRFALGSIIYQIETGHKPDIRFNGDSISTPDLEIGDQALNDIVRQAWFNAFDTDRELMRALDELVPDQECVRGREALDVTKLQALGAQVNEWRTSRIAKYGQVLRGIPSQEELQILQELQEKWNR